MSKRRMSQHQRGFTLSEILVTTAIFAIIMIAALAVYDQSNKVFKTSTEAADLQQSTRIGFDKLIADVRMAGFDYSRGGQPTNSWEAPQPDEQIEYAGTSVMAFRSNFNYNTALSNGNGLEPTYTPYNVDGQKIFPFVSTSNDEIVIYALRSADATKNTQSISFYVDDYVPRAAFPSAITPAPKPANPSHPEEILKLGPTTCGTCGIDTTNANPPYTLYRITASDVKAGRIGTPVAENIRSLNFRYYTDLNGLTPLTNPDGTALTTGRNADGSTFTAAPATCTTAATLTCTGAIGGAGQYDPDSVGTTTDYSDRDRRAIVQSIRVDLVGMNATPDIQGYQNPTETISSLKNYREFALSSLVVPRNLGKTGFPEPVYAPPAAPTITGMCTGFCGAPVIYWSAPTGGGPVEKYTVSWDTSPTGAFAAPHQADASPDSSSLVLPDDTVSDPSVTWYYRIVALNSNGSSPYSSLYTAVPKNNTKPKMTTDLHATDASTSDMQANQITLTWTSPTDNDPSMSTLACTGTGGSTDGSKIPSAEPIRYRIYRSTVKNFTLAQATTVLDFTSGAQPSGINNPPGSALTWADNSTNDSTPPANCVQYYYRIVAANRCRTNGTYNASGSAADAISDPYPNWGTDAIPGQANGSGTPAKPAALVVDAANSGCPLVSGSLCTIKLQWNKVTTDTGGAAIGIDTYRITRYSKHQNNVPSSTYTLDTSFGTGGYLDVSGFSGVSGSTATWTDTTAPVKDSVAPFAGLDNSYEYVVAAAQCGTYGADSNTADYPSSCSVNPTIVQAGGAAASGTGDSPADPWIFNAGDTITVTPPVGITLTQVKFDVSGYPSGTAISSYTDASSPFVFGWSDLVDDAIYQVTITVTTSTGCNETHIKYVQDQVPMACAFPNVTSLPAMAQSTSGSTTTASITYTVTNGGTDAMQFHVASPLFDSEAKVNWADPTGTDHPTLAFATLVWDTNSDTFSGATSPTTRTAPAAFYTSPTSLAAGSSFSFTLRYTYKKTEPALATDPTQKICISYRIPSEPGVTKYCNLVGQAASTANPNACD